MTLREKAIWFLVMAALGWLGCECLGAVSQGDGAKAILQQPVLGVVALLPAPPPASAPTNNDVTLVRPPRPRYRTNDIYWKGCKADQWYNLQASPDFTSWACIRSNVSTITVVTNARGSPPRFFRLQGRNTP